MKNRPWTLLFISVNMQLVLIKFLFYMEQLSLNLYFIF